MRILSRRFLASYLATLAACVGGCLLALAIVDMLVDFDAVVEGGGAALLRLLGRAPERWLREVLPLAAFASAFLAVALPARRGEILALRTAGIDPARATLPILGAALAVGLAATALPAPDSGRDGDGFGSALARGAWLRGDGRLYRVGGRDAGSGELRDLRVYETDRGFRLRRSLRAEGARVAGDRWELRASSELRFDPARPDSAPRRGAAPAWLPAPRDADPATESNDPGRGPLDAAATAASVGVLSLLAVPMGLGVRGGGALAGRALAALAVAALFRSAWQLAAFAGPRLPEPELAPALVLTAFAAAAAALWARAPR